MLFVADSETLGGKNPFALLPEAASIWSLADASGVDVPIPTCAIEKQGINNRKSDSLFIEPPVYVFYKKL
jgi:hypothetical protein